MISVSRGRRVVGFIAAIALMGASACRRDRGPGLPPSAVLPPTSGTLIVEGLSAPVTVVRDASGIPHITAATQDDLFFAQGFVQAQDRLFQMDLWRRSALGRLSEVLGANFIARDAATRRVQYRGNLDAEWASYGPDAKAIATAFIRGVNAWIARSLVLLPEEFVLAGWVPEAWRPEDLLNRTDAFVASRGAIDDVFRAQLISAIGAAQTDALFPTADGRRTTMPAGVDLGAVNSVLADLIRGIGAPPFFSGLAAPVAVRLKPVTTPDLLTVRRRADSTAGVRGVRLQPDRVARTGDVWPQTDPSGSNAWSVAASRDPDRSAIVAGDPHRPFTSPSLRYLVHLTAPGWNVIGATSPWRPGVAIGHNDRVAWSMTASSVDVQDLFVERVNPANPRQVQDRGAWVDMKAERDAVIVKGRSEPFEYEALYTRNGVVIGLDRDRHLAYTLRWSGTEPGGGGELAALAINRAGSWAEFRDALGRWKMPAAEFVYGDRDGHIGRQLAALVPRRAPGGGRVPAAGWSGAGDWNGWMPLNALPHAADPRDGFLVSANDSLARANRIVDLLTGMSRFDVNAARRLQHDVGSWNAERLLPLLQRLHSEQEPVELARQELVTSDRRVGLDAISALYVTWENTLRRMLVERRVPAELRAEAIGRVVDIVTPLVRPSRAWFDGSPVAARDRLLLEALEATVAELGPDRAAGSRPRAHSATFLHPLAVGDRARQRFNVGPFPVAGYSETVFATSPTNGPALQVVFDVSDWDRSVAMNAPGQSGAPASPHFADLAKLWAGGEYVPLPFTPSAVQASARSTLTLVPR